MLNLLVLKNNFNDIKNLRESSINLMKSLGEKVETLKIIYNELIANNLNETDTGLDSFHFQTKLINLELDNYQKTFKIIDNRVYGDYYKLFKKLTKYLNENIKNNNIKNKNIGTMSLILLINKVKNVLNMFFRLTSENKRS